MLLLLLPRPSALSFQLEAGRGVKERMVRKSSYSHESNQIHQGFNSSFLSNQETLDSGNTKVKQKQHGTGFTMHEVSVGTAI